jgi:tetratricopeptide (TPR) repeat protein
MRALVLAVAAAIVLVAVAVQLATSALYGELAVAGSLPARLASDWPLRAAERTGLDRIGGLRLALARAAVFRGDEGDAQRLLAGITAPADAASAADLRGRLAQHAGDAPNALRWFVVAGDFAAARGMIDELAVRDPVAAYAVIRAFDERLGSASPAPEVEADLVWREGQIAAAIAYAHPAEAPRYNRSALEAYRRALALAPNEETYLLAFGYQSLVLGDPRAARAAYASAVRVVPDSADAFVGLAAANATLGDCSAARGALAEAHDARLDAYGPLIRTPLARCRP